MLDNLLSDFFGKENIKYYSCLDVSECRLLYPKKLPQFTKSVCFFLIPYYFNDKEKRNVSVYSVPRDYHFYIKELSESFEKHKAESGISFEYRFFSDNSPFCERSGAEKCNLGKRGKNGLIINPEYGSFVFIGCVCFSLPVSISHTAENFKCDLCENCEKCKTFCPMSTGRCEECLSAITQKKKVSEAEEELISRTPVKWGCDICQLVCPYNSDIADTPIEFFVKERIPYLDIERLSEMSEEEFEKRAYAWRGIDVIKRNLGLLFR